MTGLGASCAAVVVRVGTIGKFEQISKLYRLKNSCHWRVKPLDPVSIQAYEMTQAAGLRDAGRVPGWLAGA